MERDAAKASEGLIIKALADGEYLNPNGKFDFQSKVQIEGVSVWNQQQSKNG